MVCSELHSSVRGLFGYFIFIMMLTILLRLAQDHPSLKPSLAIPHIETTDWMA